MRRRSLRYTTVEMIILSGLFFVTVFPLVEAIVLFTAFQTLPLAPPTPALSGWTPRPTTPSEAELVRRLLEGRQQLTTNCAYSDGIPLTCPPNEYCEYFYTAAAVGCCSVDVNGNFLDNCFATQCLNQAQSSLSCPATECPVGTAVW
jgi:hypothetical protein